MKKWVSCLLLVTMLFALVGCGAKKEKIEEPAEKGGVEIVTVTLPACFFTGQTAEDIDADAKEHGIKKCVVHEDGSVSYTMTSEKKDQILKTLCRVYDEKVESVVCGESSADSADGAAESSAPIEQAVSTFKSIERNKNFSLIRIISDGEYGLSDGFLLWEFLLVGAYYQLFDGVAADELEVAVEVVDQNTDEVLDTMSIQDLFSGNLVT